MRTILLILLTVLAVFAQTATLSLSSSPGLVASGQSVTLTVSLTGGGGPAALQFDVTGVPIGATVTSTVTGKTATCNGSATVTPTRCVLSGLNLTPIADGAIATLQYPQPATAPTETVANPLSATPAGSAGIALTGQVSSKCDLNADGKIDAIDVGLAVTQTLAAPVGSSINAVQIVKVLIAAFGGVCLL